MRPLSDTRFFILRLGALRCALPLLQVVETMRPLPARPLPNAPEFVSGVSVIRGEPLPVVDLALLLGVAAGKAARFVVIRSGGRKVALAVEAVVGTCTVAPETLATVPLLLSKAPADFVSALGALDKELLVVLETGRILPEEVWPSLTPMEAG
jgi:purine-binding chemotaxis protein CheW